MDFRRIRHFVVLAETLNFRRAAERLHIAQPALTVSIQKLEQELETQLFVREARGVTLTTSGQAALAEARRILFHAGNFRDAAHAAASGMGGTLRVGFVGSTTYHLLPQLVSRFRAEYPAVELVLREATSASIIKQLEDEALDVGLVRIPLLHSARITLAPLERDRFVAALPRHHPMAGRASLSLAEFADERFVMYAKEDASGLYAAAMAACQLGGFQPRIAQVATQIQTVMALVESGLGIALVPSIMHRFANARLVCIPVEDMPAAAAIGLALAYAQDIESPAGRHFRQVAQSVFPVDGAGGAQPAG